MGTAVMNRGVKIEHGVPKVSQQIAEFMAPIKAMRTTRYALNYVGITNGQMAVTNGRRLLVVSPTDTFDPPIDDGIYYLTGEGFLLKSTDDEKFPKWQDVIPRDPENLGDFVLDGADGLGTAKALIAIAGTKTLFNTRWLLDAFAKFKNCGCSAVTIKKQEGDGHPVLITADSTGVNFQYVQMPFTSVDT